MKKLFISVETLNTPNIEDFGIYHYAESAFFDVPLIAVAFDDMPAKVIDIYHGEAIPPEVLQALRDPECRKIAFDAEIARVCLSRLLKMPVGIYLPPEQWRCLKSHALYSGLPDDMNSICHILGIVDSSGDKMVNLMRKRCSALRRKRRFNELKTEWALYKECLRAKLDSVRMLSGYMDHIDMPDAEWQLYAASQRINDRGIKADKQMLANAISIYEEWFADAFHSFYIITGVNDIKRPEPFKRWLENQGVRIDSLSCESVKNCLTRHNFYPVNSALTYWLQLNRTSIGKYKRIKACMNSDGRLRGAYTYCGANAGRFGNSHVQIDNLPVSKISGLEDMRNLVYTNDRERFHALGYTVPSSLAELVATVFIPDAENTFRVFSYEALDKVVENWLFGEGGIPDFCDKLDQAFSILMEEEDEITIGKITLQINGFQMEARLPSGRVLTYRDFYWWAHDMVSISGYDDHRRWRERNCKTAKFANDIVHAVSRDILADRIMKLEETGERVVMFYPGTVIVEQSADGEDLFDLMNNLPDWASSMKPHLNMYTCNAFLEKSTDVKRCY